MYIHTCNTDIHTHAYIHAQEEDCNNIAATQLAHENLFFYPSMVTWSSVQGGYYNINNNHNNNASSKGDGDTLLIREKKR
jgi:hypothetical protein